MYTKIVHIIFDELVFRQIRSLIQITAQIFADSTGKGKRKGQRKKECKVICLNRSSYSCGVEISVELQP